MFCKFIKNLILKLKIKLSRKEKLRILRRKRQIKREFYNVYFTYYKTNKEKTK